MKIFECSHCKNQVFALHQSGVPMICCGEPMKELIAGSVDAAAEKHVPAVSVNHELMEVVVGEVIHPMTPNHYIKWIAIEQHGKTQFVELTPDVEPKASFTVVPGAYTVYEYCNLHGLWMTSGTV